MLFRNNYLILKSGQFFIKIVKSLLTFYILGILRFLASLQILIANITVIFQVQFFGWSVISCV